MRVGIDGRALTGRYTGDRTYWLNLLRALASLESSPTGPKVTYYVYSRLPIPPEALPSSPNVVGRQISANNDRLWTIVNFPRALEADSIDVAHTQYTTPLRSPCPVITTVHDISFRLYPEWFPQKHRMLLNLTVPGSMRRAITVITDSASSRRDILRIYRLDETRVHAIALGVAPEFRPMDRMEARAFVRKQFALSDPYVLSVGVLQPRKNLPLLLEAFAHAKRQAQLPHKLVLTGKKGWGVDDLSVMAARLQISDALVFTDYVPDEDLPALYSAADLVAYPSLYEGFGLPPLEAMACGAPTLVSDAPAMPEVVGDGALVLPVIDARSWAEAIGELLGDSRARESWSKRGIARAAQFKWEKTASLTRSLYEKAVCPKVAAG